MNKNWLNITGATSKVAKIKMHGVIGGGFFEEGVTAEQVALDLESISAIEADVIEVDLKSGGGSVFHGLEIYNMLKSHPAKIVIKGNVLIGSIASVIAMSADENEFSMVDNGFFLIHEGRMPSGGTANQLKQDATTLESINDTIANIYADNLNMTKDEALAIMAINNGEGELITAKDAESRGYVDKVIKPSRGNATASITQDQLNEFKINAKINVNMNEEKKEVVNDVVEPVIENNSFDLGDVTAKIVEAVKAAITPVVTEDKTEENKEVNIEELVSNEVAKEIVAINESKEAEMLAKNEELSSLQAKYDVLEAGNSNIVGADAVLEGDEKKPTASDVAAKQFVASLSEADKLMFNSEEK